MQVNTDTDELGDTEREETIREAGITKPEDRDVQDRDGPAIEVVEE